MSMKAIKDGKGYPLGVLPQNVIDDVEDLKAIDISNKFSSSNNKMRISAQKRGTRITLSATGYDGSFANGTTINISDSSLYPNVADSTFIGGGIAMLNNSQGGTYAYSVGIKRSNYIAIYFSQAITADNVQFNVVYDIV